MRLIFVFFNIFLFHFSFAQEINEKIERLYLMKKYDSVLYYSNNVQLIQYDNKIKQKFNSNFIKTLNSVAECYTAFNKNDSAIIVYAKILNLFQENKKINQLLLITIYNNLGMLYLRIGNFNLSEHYYFKSLEQIHGSSQQNYKSYLIVVENIIELYENNNKLEKAKIFINEILNYANEHMQDSISSKYLYFLFYKYSGKLAEQARNFTLAESNYKNALSFSNKIGDYTLTKGIYSLISDFYFDIGKYDLSEKYITESLRNSIRIMDSVSIAFRYDDLCRIYNIDITNINKADSVNGLARGILKKIQRPNDYIISLYRGSFIKLNLKQYRNSLTLLYEAEDIFKKNMFDSNSSLLIDIYDAKAMNYYFLKKYDSSDIYFNKLYRYVQNSNYSNNRALGFYSSVLGELKNLSKRDSVIKQYTEQEIMEISFLMPLKSSSEKIKLIQSKKRVIDSYFSNLLLDSNKIEFLSETGYNILLKTKGFGLSDDININKLFDSANIELKTDFIKLKDVKLKYQLANFKNRELEIIIDGLEEKISKSSKPFERAQLHNRISYKNIISKLKNDEIALEFFDIVNRNFKIEREVYFVMIAKKDWKEPKFIPLFEKKQLVEILTKQENILPSIFYNELYNINHKKSILYDLIIKPIEKYLLGSSVLYIAPNNLLHYINFNAITTSENIFLGEKYEVHTLGSTSDILNRENVYLNDSRINSYIFGGINYDTVNTLKNDNKINFQIIYDSNHIRSFNKTWSYLKYTFDEATEIQSIFKKNNHDVKLFSGSDASEIQLKNLSINDNSYILHLATHGFYFPLNISIKQFSNNYQYSINNSLVRSGLVLAGANKYWFKEENLSGYEDGILSAFEVSNMNFNKCKLVVLSACETGLGDILNSEGVFGLQRAFKISNVQNILTSLWKVPDLQTKELMIKFYTFCLDGLSTANALQKAQAEMRKTYAPYYWAAFRLLE
jgi:CHAT domain-containing protein